MKLKIDLHRVSLPLGSPTETLSDLFEVEQESEELNDVRYDLCLWLSGL